MDHIISNMEVDLIPVKRTEKKILQRLIEDYEKELLGIEKPEKYKYLDSYWEKPNRFPYFIKVNNQVAGFVLINDYNLVNKDGKNIAEFYVRKEFRQKGIGKLAAKLAFSLFPGKWEVRELRENINGQNFWRKIVSEYTQNNFQEKFLDTKDWCGPVQIFKIL